MRKESQFQILKKWKQIYQNNDKISMDFNVRSLLVVVFFSLILCACQKRTEVMIYSGSNDDYDLTDGLNVENGDYEAALMRCQERLQQLQEDSIEAADVYSQMGDIYADYVGDKEKAMYYLEKAIIIHRESDDEIGLANDYGAMAVACSLDGELEAGLAYLKEAEILYRRNGLAESFGLAWLLCNKGQLYKQAGQLDYALEAYKAAQEIHIKRREEGVNIYIYAGQVYMEMEDYESAEREYLDAIRVSQETEDLYKEAAANWSLGRLYVQKEEYEKAIELYEKSLQFYKTDKIYSADEASVYSKIAYAYTHSGNLEKAFEPAISACRIIENLEMNTDNKESQEVYKHNLSMYYKGWTEDMSSEGFEKWYQSVVREGKDWKELERTIDDV